MAKKTFNEMMIEVAVRVLTQRHHARVHSQSQRKLLSRINMAQGGESVQELRAEHYNSLGRLCDLTMEEITAEAEKFLGL